MMGETHPEVEASLHNLHRKAAGFSTAADQLDTLLTNHANDDLTVDGWLIEVHATFSELMAALNYFREVRAVRGAA